MNQYKLALAGINLNEGLARFNNNEKLYSRFLYEFVNDKHYLQLCSALTEKDVEGAFQAAHALKGVAGNLSLQHLMKALTPVVETLRAGNMPDPEADITPLCTAYKETIEAIKADKLEAAQEAAEK